MVDQITRTFRYTYKTILHAKLRNFAKKSMWKYLLTSLFIAYGSSGYFGNLFGSFINRFWILFISLILLSAALIAVSCYILYVKKRQDNMDITFKENKIEVNWTFKGIKETKGWDWVKGFEQVNNICYFDLDVWPKNVLMIDQRKLSAAEIQTLRRWLEKNGKKK